MIERKTLWHAGAVSILALVAGMLEAIGIGLIFVFVQALIDPTQIQNIAVVGKLVGPAFVENETEALILMSFGLLAGFLIKNLILIGFYYFQASFTAANEASLAVRLLDSYLKGAYSLHLRRNSADLIRNITGSVTAIFGTVITGFINLASEAVMIVALIVVLLMAEPMLTLGAFLVLGAAVAIFFSFSKSRFSAWGMREQKATGEVLKSLQQGFHNIKEVKILGRQRYILESFESPCLELAGIRTKLRAMSGAPRLWVESVIVAAVLLAVISILSSGGRSAEILSSITLFAIAAFRMIPSMNRIIIALNGIKSGSHAVELIYQDLHAFRANPDEESEDDGQTLAFKTALSINGVSFSYDQGNGAVLKDIDLVLNKGESMGLVGRSGSGKTTLVDIVLSLLVPDSGAVTVDGTNIRDAPSAWRRQIGYVPQSIYITDDTLRRNIAFGLADHEISEDMIQNAVRLAQLESFVRGLPDGLETQLGDRGTRLSGGQRQRVGIARALYRDPGVLIFDEATSSLDSETEQEVNQAIEKFRGEKTMIIIAHRLSTVRACDRVVFLKDGRIDDIGTFEELAARNSNFNNLVELAKL